MKPGTSHIPNRDAGERHESRPGTQSAAARLSLAVICFAAFFLAVRPVAAVTGPDPRSLDEAPMMAELLLATALLLAGWRLVSQHHRAPSAEGVGLAVDGKSDHNLAAAQARINDVLTTQALVTAFQPIYSLATRTVIGAEALTRIVSSPVRTPETWFAEAESVGRGLDLEFLAMERALRAAGQLPGNIYVAVNLSPRACLDPRLSSVLLECGLPAGRIVVELTERTAVTEYGPLLQALTRWRQSGLRIAVDDACAGYANMRHILRLKPDIIKLDRSIIAGVDADRYTRALCAALVSFAQETTATLVAEGLETETELSAVEELGVDSAQGYLLGKPSTSAADWLPWGSESSPGVAPGRQ